MLQRGLCRGRRAQGGLSPSLCCKQAGETPAQPWTPQCPWPHTPLLGPCSASRPPKHPLLPLAKPPQRLLAAGLFRDCALYQ